MGYKILTKMTFYHLDNTKFEKLNFETNVKPTDFTTYFEEKRFSASNCLAALSYIEEKFIDLEKVHMFKKNFPNYFYTSDGIRIFYNTNFQQNELDSTKSRIGSYLWTSLLAITILNFKYLFSNSHGYQILIHDYRFHYRLVSGW